MSSSSLLLLRDAAMFFRTATLTLQIYWQAKKDGLNMSECGHGSLFKSFKTQTSSITCHCYAFRSEGPTSRQHSSRFRVSFNKVLRQQSKGKRQSRKSKNTHKPITTNRNQVCSQNGGKSNKDRVESETHVISKQKQKAHDTTTWSKHKQKHLLPEKQELKQQNHSQIE